MISTCTTVTDYLASLPTERRSQAIMLRHAILDNLPTGYVETMAYGMPCYVVPLDIYPAGYHCKKGQPLPYMSFAMQKNYCAVYHLGLYADQAIYSWFIDAWKKASPKKLDMGKSCIRLKVIAPETAQLCGELAKTFTVERWVAFYEATFKKGARV